jgi:phospholipase C
MQRRDFLKAGFALGGAALLSGCRIFPLNPTPRARHDSVLDGAPGDSNIDTVVICMMENRSFDSYLGWLARDDVYLNRSRGIYGDDFYVNGKSFQTFPSPQGGTVDTYRRVLHPEADPWRGCGLNDPGHGWNQGRAERDGGFLATGSNNDLFALGYFEGDDLPFYERFAHRFIVCDQWHASVLGPTYPNREYLMSGQSGGNKTNAFPTGDGFQWTNIIDRLAAAGVTAGEYYGDFPMYALFGSRMLPHLHPMTQFPADAAAGKLPHVTFVTPSFVGDDVRTDDHPHGDPRAAQRFVRDAFSAFYKSPHWHNGVFIVTYDEWGGFFDHVAPPHLPDDRANANDADDFSQAGFRVPTMIASPRGLPSAVDHTQYDHTSILRFIEWRFLGAPPRGPGSGTAPWALTTRDRYAANAGELLSAEYFDPTLYFPDNLTLPAPSAGCAAPAAGPESTLQQRVADTSPDEDSPWVAGIENGYWDRVGVKVPVG